MQKIWKNLCLKISMNINFQLSLLIYCYTQSFSPQLVPAVCESAAILEPTLAIFIILAQLHFKPLLLQ